MPEFGGRHFQTVRGSDVIRDGMYLELIEGSDEMVALAEIFFSDETEDFVFNTFGNDLPLEAVEWLIAEARVLLPPTRS